MLYALLKSCLDPVFMLLIFMLVGFLIALKKGKSPSLRTVLIASLVCLYLISISPTGNALCYLLEKDFLSPDNWAPPSLDVIVVLGGGSSEIISLRSTFPSLQTSTRLLRAVQVWRMSGAQYLVCAGQGGSSKTEAEVMAREAIRLGIPEKSIILDPQSRNTKEHAEVFNRRFADKNLHIGLVTSAFHLRRSEREFKKYFPHVIPIPSDFLYSSGNLSLYTFLPHSSKLHKFSLAFYELFGLAYYRFR